MDGALVRGIIKFYNVAKRFGFIVPDDGSGDLYFAESSLPRSRRYDPVEGDSVEFEPRETDKPNRVAIRIVVDSEHPTAGAAAHLTNGHAHEDSR